MMRQANAFAMEYGLILGLLQTAAFVTFMKAVDYPWLFLVFLGLLASFPLLVLVFAMRYERSVRDEGDVTYVRAYFLSFMTCFYASVVLCLGAYIYLQFYDCGAFVARQLELLAQPDMKALLESEPMKSQLAQMMADTGAESMPDVFAQFTPPFVVAGLFNITVMAGTVVSIITAIFARTPRACRRQPL